MHATYFVLVGRRLSPLNILQLLTPLVGSRERYAGVANINFK